MNWLLTFFSPHNVYQSTGSIIRIFQIISIIQPQHPRRMFQSIVQVQDLRSLFLIRKWSSQPVFRGLLPVILIVHVLFLIQYFRSKSIIQSHKKINLIRRLPNSSPYLPFWIRLHSFLIRNMIWTAALYPTPGLKSKSAVSLKKGGVSKLSSRNMHIDNPIAMVRFLL